MSAQKIVSPFPDKFSDRQWGRYVRRGRDLVLEESRIQFELGDITLKMVPARRGDHGVFQVLDRYADQIGINVRTLTDYRLVANHWPPEERVPDVPWSVHRALEALEDRFEVIHQPPGSAQRWTEDMALRRAGRMPHRQLTKAEKLDRVRVLLHHDDSAVEAVGELIKRPDVAEGVMGDQANKRILYRAHQQRRQQAEEARWQEAYSHVEGEPDNDGGGEELSPDEATAQEVEGTRGARETVRRREAAVDYTRASREVLELLGAGTGFLVELQRVIPGLHVGEFTDREVQAVLDNHRRIRAALDWCDTVVTTGDKSMDEGLARILEEGDELP